MKRTQNTANRRMGNVAKRPAEERGRTRLGWLNSWHSFSFGEYFDPDRMGFRSLRVLNDDIVDAGTGFPLHPHRDAEIFTYVIDGELEHRDSMGNHGLIRAGDLQYMSAGAGVRHSEMNPSSERAVHLLQIWLRPRSSGGEPRYAEKPMGTAAKPDALTLLFSGHSREGAVEIRQDADIYFGKLSAGKRLLVPAARDQGVWIQIIRGKITAAGQDLAPGDALAASDVTQIDLIAAADAEFLVFVMD